MHTTWSINHAHAFVHRVVLHGEVEVVAQLLVRLATVMKLLEEVAAVALDHGVAVHHGVALEGSAARERAARLSARSCRCAAPSTRHHRRKLR